jgi:hypothetical protein
MKVTMITLAAILSLTMNVLFAGSFDPVINSELNSSYVILAPATPAEATFEEMPAADFLVLAPVTPAEADFSDVPEVNADLFALAPTTPEETDFKSEDVPVAGSINLAPVTPDSADFCETI